MNLNGRSTTLYLSQSGSAFLSSMMGDSLAVWDLSEGQHGIVIAEIEESEDLGVWLRLERDAVPKFFLLRWEFIVGIEFTNDEKSKVVGLRG